MDLLIDTREKLPLTFQFVQGISVKSECLAVGDYGCRHSDGTMDDTVFERKAIGDLFLSFSSGYENEKAKIEKAKKLGLKYILAVEGTAFDVRTGHTYQKDGQEFCSKKDGLSQVRQLMTMYRKDYFHVMWCRDRKEMAFLIQEYFLAGQRIRESAPTSGAVKRSVSNKTTAVEP